MRIAHLDGDPYVHIPLPTREPLCAICEKPIRWALDMFSMVNGFDRRLAHARCVWTQEAFLRESHRAPSNVEKATPMSEYVCPDHGRFFAHMRAQCGCDKAVPA